MLSFFFSSAASSSSYCNLCQNISFLIVFVFSLCLREKKDPKAIETGKQTWVAGREPPPPREKLLRGFVFLPLF